MKLSKIISNILKQYNNVTFMTYYLSYNQINIYLFGYMETLLINKYVDIFFISKIYFKSNKNQIRSIEI